MVQREVSQVQAYLTVALSCFDLCMFMAQDFQHILPGPIKRSIEMNLIEFENDRVINTRNSHGTRGHPSISVKHTSLWNSRLRAETFSLKSERWALVGPPLIGWSFALLGKLGWKNCEVSQQKVQQLTTYSIPYNMHVYQISNIYHHHYGR